MNGHIHLKIYQNMKNGKKIEYNIVEILDNLNYNQNVGNVIETEDGYKVVIENTEQVGNIKSKQKGNI